MERKIMSNNMALSHDRFLNCKAEGNKDISMTLSVYAGSLCLNIFKIGLDRPVRLQFPRSGCVLLKDALHAAIDGQPGHKVEIDIKKFNRDSKRSEKVGTLVVGRDEAGMIFFGVVEQRIPPSKFLLRASGDMEISATITDSERSLLGARTLIEQLTTDIPMAMMLTSFKNQQPSQSYKNAYKSDNNSSNLGQNQSSPWA